MVIDDIGVPDPLMESESLTAILVSVESSPYRRASPPQAAEHSPAPVSSEPVWWLVLCLLVLSAIAAPLLRQ